jgi:multidrug efflux pump subunit AcrB
VIALMGMILRNSVILVDQIEQDEQAGKSEWDAKACLQGVYLVHACEELL